MAPLISSPIKSISCPRAYFRQFISPVASSNRPYPGLPSQKVWCDVCLSGVLYRSLMLLSPPTIPNDYTSPTIYRYLCQYSLLAQSFVSTLSRTKWAELSENCGTFCTLFKISRSIVKLSCREAERNGTDVIHVHLVSLSQRWSCDSLTYKKSYLLIDRLIFNKINKNEIMSGTVLPLLHAASLM